MTRRFMWGRRVVGVVAVALALGAAFWAGRVTSRPVAVPPDVPTGALTAEVLQTTVGKTLHYTVTVDREKRPVAANIRQGVVTKVGASGTYQPGDVVYAVDNAPVCVLQGGVPFWRDMAVDAVGPDVAQLRGGLVAMDLLADAGDRFDGATEAAVRAWQRKLGVPETGVIKRGDVVAAPAIPGVIDIDGSQIQLGSPLVGGEKVVRAVTGEPRFTLKLSAEQLRLVPPSAAIVVKHKTKAWPAVIADIKDHPERADLSVATLTSPDGGTVCGAECGELPTESSLSLVSDIAVVPPVTGPGVPVTAILTNPDRTTKVIVVAADGTRTDRLVTVLAAQDGIAVIDGVQPGEIVQVLADGTGALIPTTGPSSTRPGSPSPSR